MGGALVELAEHLPFQTPLSILMQTDEGSVGIEAQVVWTREHVALGAVLHAVMFTQRLPEIVQDLLLTQGVERIPRVRLATDLDVTCRSRGETRGPIQGRAADAGRGGLLLCLPEEVSPGSAVELSLYTSEVPVLAGGTIVWVDPPDRRAPGGPVRHGVQFTSVSMSVLKALGLFLVEPK
jgi:hypothetical protein